MSNFKIFLLVQFIFFSAMEVLAQVDTGWIRRYNGPGNGWDEAAAIAIDGSGNVYVTGSSYNGYPGYFDYVTIMYNPKGNTAWVRSYNGPGNAWDEATAVAVDRSGNVYVTGNSGTIRYLANGDEAWVNNSVVVHNPVLAVRDSWNVYVAGSSGTIRYSPSGDSLWFRVYGGVDLAIDDWGYIYVTGGVWYYITVKYAPNGDTLWVRYYFGPAEWNEAHAVAVDGSGNVYVTGSSNYGYPGYFDYATVKYDSNGATLWVDGYNGPGNNYDIASALAADDSGNVYVTGTSWGSGTRYDYATIKYDPNGDALWIRRYNGPGNNDDIVSDLAVDDSGNAYVTGYSTGAGTSWDYATIKYSSNGDTLWVRRYDGPANDDDGAVGLAVDSSGNVNVTGYSFGKESSYDYVTIKYNKFGCAALAGDINGDYNVGLPDIMLQINYLFKAGAKPDPFCSGDANANGNILLTDIVYLINYIFRSGQAPIKSNECCL